MNEDAPPERAEKRPGAVTIVDVAKDAGVSHSTVSRVLNDHPYIKAATRERVEASLKKLGYVANLRARSLAGGRLGVIGLVVLNLESSYNTQIVRGVDAALADAGWDLMLCTTHQRETQETSYVSRLSVGLADGLIVLVPVHARRYARELAERQFPFVLIDYVGPDRASIVLADNHSGVRQSIDHLRGLGHERIAAITGDLTFPVGIDRMNLFRQGMAEAGLDLPDDYIIEGDFRYERGREAMAQLLDLPVPPTAVFASSDTAALGALRTVKERGLRVPEDMSILGFDDVPEAALSTPPLTTIRQPLADIAREAVQALIRQIENPGQTPTRITFPVELVVRGTTAPPADQNTHNPE